MTLALCFLPAVVFVAFSFWGLFKCDVPYCENTGRAYFDGLTRSGDA